MVQRWPAVPIAAKVTPPSVRSRSAVGVTTAALLPPSSKIARAKRWASFGATARPIAVEPVAETKERWEYSDQQPYKDLTLGFYERVERHLKLARHSASASAAMVPSCTYMAPGLRWRSLMRRHSSLKNCCFSIRTSPPVS